jgi:hypothetical protein
VWSDIEAGDLNGASLLNAARSRDLLTGCNSAKRGTVNTKIKPLSPQI